MKLVLVLSILWWGMGLLSGAEAPAPGEFMGRVRHGHPRLFLTPEGIPALRQRATTVLGEEFAVLCREVDALPEVPQLEFLPEVCTVRGKRILFKKLLNDQNACIYGVKSTGGHEALKSALAYVVTGRESYRRKAVAHIRLNVSFIEYCHASKMLYEWFHFTRLNTLIAYDWIADTLTPEERRNLMAPMLKHVEFMQHPGFKRNVGGVESGNYGETALTYYAGLATLGDGVDDALAQRLLAIGYRHFVEMMDYRDYVSGGSGMLSSICAGYSFGMYPTSSFNFLRTLKSAAGIDGTRLWTQLLRYPHWFLWAAIPSRQGLLEYGFGDSFHLKNDIPVWKMYSHMAQIIDLFGESHPDTADAAWTVISVLPEEEREIRCKSFPILPYIMTSFRPDMPRVKTVSEILGQQTGALFRQGGLTIMRSGFSPDDTYVAFKAGGRFVQHQHYDENSFVIYRGGFQALDSGCRGPKPHQKAYFPQTVAHNAILIRQSGEKLPEYWYTGPAIKGQLWNDGGQNRMGVGRLLGFESHALYAAAAGDARRCYAASTCREATRVMVFVKPCYVLVYDRVSSVRSDQDKVFLLHFNGEPQALGPGLFKAEEGSGSLFVQTLLPASSNAETIGGAGRQFWTQGSNYLPHRYEVMSRQPNNLGAWRLEIKAGSPRKHTRFLHVLQTAPRGERQPVPAERMSDVQTDGVRLKTAEGVTVTVRFRRQGRAGGTILMEKGGTILLNQELFGPLKEGESALRHPARVDVIPDSPTLKFEIVDLGDTCQRETPRWLKGGRGAILQFTAGGRWKQGAVTLRTRGTGRAHLLLRGPDVKGGTGGRLKKWIGFKSLTINGRELLPEGQEPVIWHDAPKRLDFQCHDGQTLILKAIFRTVETN